VTTEDDFQQQLDRHPEDHQTRLVFADWLQERGDPRAEGYRALGALRRIPRPYTHGNKPGVWRGATEFLYWNPLAENKDNPSMLPQDWFDAIPREDANPDDRGSNYRSRSTRRAAEDTAARAFTRLPVARRAELLSDAASTGEPSAPRAAQKARRKRRTSNPKSRRKK
jgi:uncharacterized protein (TIGR02996 family)